MKADYVIKKLSALILTALCIAAKAQKPVDGTKVQNPATLEQTYKPGTYIQNLPVSYRRSWAPQRPYSLETDVFTSERTVEEVIRATQYSDGSGRPIQSVVWQSSPSKKDLVDVMEYDGFGKQSYGLLPYVSTSGNGNFKTNPFVEQYDFYTGSAGYLAEQPGIANEKFFYSKNIYELSPLNRVIKNFAPGNSWVGTEGTGTSERARKIEYLTNVENSDDVKRWAITYNSLTYISEDINTNIPTTTSTTRYLTGELAKVVITDEKGNKVVEYTDPNGNTVLKKVQISASPSASYAGWLCTYYVYDDFGLLRFIIPPKVVAKMVETGSWALTTSQINGLCFRYEYDKRKRLIGKKLPGVGWGYVVYDNRDRVVFTQDVNLRQKKQWICLKYDSQERLVQKGIVVYTGTGNKTRDDLQLYMDGLTGLSSGQTTSLSLISNVPADLNINKRQTGRSLYQASSSVFFEAGFESETNADFEAKIVSGTSTSVSSTQEIMDDPAPPGFTFTPLIVTYYDDYSWTSKTYSTSNNSKLDIGGNVYGDPLPAAAEQRTDDFITGARVRILSDPNNLSSGKWMENVIFYDEKGRSIQTVSDNQKGGTERVTRRFDFTSKIVSVYSIHNNSAANVVNLSVKTNYDYDHAGRLLKVTKKVNDLASSVRTIARYEYDALGRIKLKKIGQKRNDNGSLSADPIEIQAYSYNVRGWLKGINWEYPGTGVTTKSKSGSWFAEDLSYDWGFESKEYGGNIAGARWVSAGDKEERAYGYTYDASGRFLKADFNQKFGSTWGKDGSAGSNFRIDFSVKMGSDGTNAATAYDENGNILRMQQWGLKLMQSPQIDNLVYNYYTDENKLKNVQDSYNDPQTSLGDFRTSTNHPDKSNATNTRIDYEYDLNGSLVKDLNKDFGTTSTNGIEYNFLSLPARVTKYAPNVAGGIASTLNYVYDASGAKLEKIFYSAPSSANQQTSKTTVSTYIGGFFYENNVLQFLGHEEGRVREKKDANGNFVEYIYDYFLKDHLGSVRSVLSDEQKTDGYQATMETANRAVEKQLFDKIEETESPKPQDWDGSGTVGKVSKLNGTTEAGRIGPSLVLKVMAGDKFNISTQVFYRPTEGTNATDNTLTDIATALVTALAPGVETMSMGKASTAAVSTSVLPNGLQAFYDSRNYNTAQGPKAYLNWVVLDDEQFSKVQDASSGQTNWGFIQVPAFNAGEPFKVMQANSGNDITVIKNGYLCVYVSNESKNDVYFDNLTVLHKRGPLLEEDHYYPFGLKMAGISSKAIGEIKNKYLYQGNYSELNEETGWYEFDLRSYDAQIGRWLSVDPYDEFPSPYVGMANDPVNNLDPDGGCTDCNLFVTVHATIKNGTAHLQNQKFILYTRNILKKGLSLVRVTKTVHNYSNGKESFVTDEFHGDKVNAYGDEWSYQGTSQETGYYSDFREGLSKDDLQNRYRRFYEKYNNLFKHGKKYAFDEALERAAKDWNHGHATSEGGIWKQVNQDFFSNGKGEKILLYPEAIQMVDGPETWIFDGTFLAAKAALKGTLGFVTKRIIVGNGGSYVSSMNVVREVVRGETIDDLVSFAQDRTFSTGVEHALVRLGPNSIAPGARVIVSGGPHGISFEPGEISVLFGHTHPYVSGASAADFKALKILGQSKQYIYEGFNKTPLLIRP